MEKNTFKGIDDGIKKDSKKPSRFSWWIFWIH